MLTTDLDLIIENMIKPDNMVRKKDVRQQVDYRKVDLNG